MVFDKWARDGEPVVVLPLDAPSALTSLRDWYCDGNEKVLLEILDQAYRLGAQCVVVEPRYVDVDYRNEHSRFYSTTFRRYPSVAHRVHFFKDRITLPATPTPFMFRSYGIAGYLGYVVLRPLRAAAVGRTMLKAPASVRPHAIVCMAEDRVNLAGSELTVQGMPFYAQDRQLSRCGQATLLATAYYHHRVFGQRRVLPGEIADAVAASGGDLGRPVPSPGLNTEQLVAAASAIGLPPVVYQLDDLASIGQSVAQTLCWYLNSRLPVTIATRSHAFLLVGYDRRDNPDDSQDIRFLRQDDEGGPYQWVEQWRLDELYGPWKQAIVPMPPKVYLRGEDAERAGSVSLKDMLGRSDHPDDQALLARLNDPSRPLSWRSAVVPSTDFKRRVRQRNVPDAIAAAYQLTPMSRYVWVVELTDRQERDGRKPCVLAEMIIDATDHERDIKPLAWRLPSGLGVQVPDTDQTKWDPTLGTTTPILSVIEAFTPHLPISP